MITIENQTGQSQSIGIGNPNDERIKIVLVSNNSVRSFPEYIFDLHILIKKFDPKDYNNGQT